MLINFLFSNWDCHIGGLQFKFYFKQERHRDCHNLFMIYVQLVKQKSFPLHYANAQLQLDGGLYHCELIFCSGLCPVVMRRRQWQCTFVWGLPEESRTLSVRSTQCKVRYRACVHDIVCVLHCYLRKRPGPYRCSHFSKLSRYCAALACCVLCAYCTSVSVQTANRIGVCSVGLLPVVRSGVWSSLWAPLTSGGH